MKITYSSQILKILNSSNCSYKNWIIDDLTNDTSVMLWHERKFEITAAYLRRRPSTFWKTVEKKWWDFILKKRQLSEYVTKVIKNLFRNTFFKSLIEQLLIYHKKQELNDFGPKIRIFDISNIKNFEKNIFTGNCSCDLKISSVKIFQASDIWISAGILLEIEMHCIERGRTLNLFCRVYKHAASVF